MFITAVFGIQPLIAEQPTVESLERRIKVLEEKMAALDAQVSEARNKEDKSLSPDSVARGEIIVNVSEDGHIRVEGQELDDDAFTKILKSVATKFPNQPVRIRGDLTTKYQNIVHVIDLCQSAGISNISFATAKKKAEQAGAGHSNTDSAVQATSPVDLSGATSENALDKNVGKWVTFTGKWQNTKEGGLSNGHVSISPTGGSAYIVGSTGTLTGYLTRIIVPVRHSQLSDKARQYPPPGKYYYIDKDPPARNSADPTKAEPAGAGQPATKPADKAPVKDQPSPPTPRVVPR